MKTNKGSISIVLLVALIVILTSASIATLAVNSKFEARASYERINSRYIAESGIDMAIGLFINYLSNKSYVLTYTKHEDDSFTVINEFSPYLLDEIKNAISDDVKIEIVESESSTYLSSIGYLDFMRGNGIEITVSTFGQKERFKLSEMCISHNFLVSSSSNESSEYRSIINPLYLAVKATYKGGEVFATANISGIEVVREKFTDCDTNEMASVRAWVDTKNAKTEFETYQNYRLRGGLN